MRKEKGIGRSEARKTPGTAQDTGLLAKGQCPPGPLPSDPFPVRRPGSAPAREGDSAQTAVRVRIRSDSVRLSHVQPRLT